MNKLAEFFLYGLLFMQVNVMYAQQGPSVPVAKNKIRLNQVGFYPSWEKLAIVEGNVSGQVFYVKSPDLRNTYFKGNLSTVATWEYSNEFVTVADFSAFTTPGQFVITVEGLAEKSPPFSILPKVNDRSAAINMPANFGWNGTKQPCFRIPT